MPRQLVDTLRPVKEKPQLTEERAHLCDRHLVAARERAGEVVEIRHDTNAQRAKLRYRDVHHLDEGAKRVAQAEGEHLEAEVAAEGAETEDVQWLGCTSAW